MSSNGYKRNLVERGWFLHPADLGSRRCPNILRQKTIEPIQSSEDQSMPYAHCLLFGHLQLFGSDCEYYSRIYRIRSIEHGFHRIQLLILYTYS